MRYAVVSIDVDVPFESQINHLTVPIPLILVVAKSPWIGASIVVIFPIKSERIGVMDRDALLSITIGILFLLLQNADEL